MNAPHTGPMAPALPVQTICEDVLQEKYLKPGEDCADDVLRRVAKALASVELPALQAKYEA